MVVEPLSRKLRSPELTRAYSAKVKVVRESLPKLIDASCIIKTTQLHYVSDDQFIEDGIHLNEKGLSELCIAYKKTVFPILGIRYTPGSASRHMNHMHVNTYNSNNNVARSASYRNHNESRSPKINFDRLRFLIENGDLLMA